MMKLSAVLDIRSTFSIFFQFHTSVSMTWCRSVDVVASVLPQGTLHVESKVLRMQ